jgi:hypothetical protein
MAPIKVPNLGSEKSFLFWIRKKFHVLAQKKFLIMAPKKCQKNWVGR